MNKNTFLIVALIIFVHSSYCQISSDAIKKSKNYINYKLTDYCIASYVNSTSGIKNKKVYDSIQANLSTAKVQTVQSYETLNSVLSNRFEKVKQKLSAKIEALNFDTLVNQSHDSIATTITTRCFKLYNDAYGHTFPLNLPESTIKNDLLAFYQESSVQSDTKPEDTEGVDKLAQEVKASKEHDFFSFNNNNIFTLLPFLLIIILFLYVIIENKKINKRIDRRVIKNDEGNLSIDLKSTTGSFENLNRIERDEILNLRKEIKRLNDSIIKDDKRIDALESKLTNKVPKIEPELVQKQTLEIFYMMKPIDNYFPNSNKSYSKNDTVFKFTSNDNRTEAIFEVHTSGAPVNDIARRNEAYLKPACEEENMPSNKVNNIITLRKGLAFLDGDKWIIKQKALIRYE